MNERILLSPEVAAEALSLSRATIFDLIRKGKIRSIKIGRSRRIPVSALEEFVEHAGDVGVKDSEPTVA